MRQIDCNSLRITGNTNFRKKLCVHMSNTLDQIPVDKTWSPTECSRKINPEVQ